MSKEVNNRPDSLGFPEGAVTSSATQIRVQKEGKFAQIYTNNVQIGFSSWDMAISFGQIVGEQDDKSVVEEIVRVIMPRELGKVLARLLTANIEAFEQEYGEIRLPGTVLADQADAGQGTDDTNPAKAMSNAVKKMKRSKK